MYVYIQLIHLKCWMQRKKHNKAEILDSLWTESSWIDPWCSPVSLSFVSEVPLDCSLLIQCDNSSGWWFGNLVWPKRLWITPELRQVMIIPYRINAERKITEFKDSEEASALQYVCFSRKGHNYSCFQAFEVQWEGDGLFTDGYRWKTISSLVYPSREATWHFYCLLLFILSDQWSFFWNRATGLITEWPLAESPAARQVPIDHLVHWVLVGAGTWPYS